MTSRPLKTRYIAAIQVLALLVTSMVAAPAAALVTGPPTDARGVVIVWEAGSARTASSTQALEQRGLRVRRVSRDGRLTVVAADSEDALVLAGELSRLPGVAYAEPDYRVSIAWEPDDPDYQSGDQWAYSHIQGPEAWDVERGENTVVVAVVDTGVDLAHPDLVDRLDTTNDRNLTVPPTDIGYNVAADDNGHGTHVAGIVAASTDNGIGVAGTAPGVRILPLKTMDADGTGDSSVVAEAIDYATTMDVDVINLSLALDYGQQSTVLRDAIQRASAAGIVVVAASGNSGSSSVRYPAAYPECIAVGSTGPTDTRMGYSNYGSALDVVAPGGGTTTADMIYSTYWIAEGGSTYAFSAGTSMATPFVAGAAALLRSYDPSATPGQIRSAIEMSAKDIGAAGFDVYTGHGLLQLRNALDHLSGQDTQAPSTISDAIAEYDDAASISFTADDGAGFGVAATYFALDGGLLQRGASVSASGYGTHEIEYWSDDVVGNRETTTTETFFIDDTLAPVTSSNAVATYESTATVTLSAGDGSGSGVASTWYAVDEAPPVTGSVAVISDMGAHTLQFGSVDLVGNRETTKTASISVLGVPVVSRVAGANRYSTAVALTAATYLPDSATTVVLASGEDFPDALSASGLAGALDAPLLLSAKRYLPTEVVVELLRLGAEHVIIVGGEAAVSTAVEGALASMGLTTERLEGPDRFSTGAAVAGRIVEESMPATVPLAFLVRSDMFPDALAVSSLAASQGHPVLLTPTDELSSVTAQTLMDLGVSEVVIVGSERAVSAGVASAVDALPGVTVVRRQGSDRYSTAASIVAFGLERAMVGADFMGVATGADFPDALGGGVIAAEKNGVLLLSDPRTLLPVTSASIVENGTDHLPIWVYGSKTAVADTVKNAIAALRF